jgi:cytochrome b
MQREFIVWDLPLRLFHWSLLILVCSAWATRRWGDIELNLHAWCGYVLLTVLAFRLLWGCLGGETARFRSFIKGPFTVLRYLKEGLPPTIGHNPLGGWAVVVLLSLLTAQTISGLFADDGLFAHGPWAMYLSDELRQWFTTAHVYLFDVLTAMIVLHLVALLMHRFKGERGIFRAMITGRHQSAQNISVFPPALLPRALFCAAVALSCVWSLMTFV